jgi:hypothetical protein
MIKTGAYHAPVFQIFLIFVTIPIKSKVIDDIILISIHIILEKVIERGEASAHTY